VRAQNGDFLGRERRKRIDDAACGRGCSGYISRSPTTHPPRARNALLIDPVIELKAFLAGVRVQGQSTVSMMKQRARPNESEFRRNHASPFHPLRPLRDTAARWRARRRFPSFFIVNVPNLCFGWGR
jgi:hypothetical protein